MQRVGLDERETMDLPDVRGIEERAFRAWPAYETVRLDGWVARFASGYTKRANSIQAIDPFGSFDATLAASRKLFASRRLPLIYRLTPLAPSDSDAILAALGFAFRDETLVMTATLVDRSTVDASVEIDMRPTRPWLAAFADAARIDDVDAARHDTIVTAIRQPSAFAVTRHDGALATFGFAVLDREMVGLFDVLTRPSYRRMGCAASLVTTLMAWGRHGGATVAYLQVARANEGAIRLYRRLGFSELYRYHYRIET